MHQVCAFDAPALLGRGSSLDLCCTGNSRPVFGLFRNLAKGVK